jgi:hypothetical protein
VILPVVDQQLQLKEFLRNSGSNPATAGLPPAEWEEWAHKEFGRDVTLSAIETYWLFCPMAAAATGSRVVMATGIRGRDLSLACWCSGKDYIHDIDPSLVS